MVQVVQNRDPVLVPVPVQEEDDIKIKKIKIHTTKSENTFQKSKDGGSN